MHRIFVGDKPIILSTRAKEKPHIINYRLDAVNIRQVIRDLKRKDIRSVRLVDEHPEMLLKKFLKLLPNVIAGGGKVINSKGHILFIYRNDKWDLPKGRAESRETIDITAIREVEEETGVKNLKIIRPLELTYHIFRRNGKYRIKITYWFEMYTDYDGPLSPQANEGITDVTWLSPKKALTALKNSYANIKTLIEDVPA